jgi:hypothetical protein
MARPLAGCRGGAAFPPCSTSRVISLMRLMHVVPMLPEGPTECPHHGVEERAMAARLMMIYR